MGLAELDDRVEERVGDDCGPGGDDSGPGLQLMRSGAADDRPLPHAGRLKVGRYPEYQEWHDHRCTRTGGDCCGLLVSG
jgi:hypothetical protein